MSNCPNWSGAIIDFFYFNHRGDNEPKTYSSTKYIKQNLIREIENLKAVNESLRIMSNNATIRDIESRKKVVELENCNHAVMEIMRTQKEANDLLQQKNELLETQLSLLNNPERNSSFGSTLVLSK